MNPELLRNLWLEASPIRLALIAGLVLLVFAAASAVPPQWGTPESAALVPQVHSRSARVELPYAC